MKKIVFIGVLIFVVLSWIPTQPVYAVEKEIKEVVEEFIKVKMIEERIVLGYPIEDVALIGNLKQGRDIEYVVEYFEKYYEEDVLKKYLYYLKRSTSQKLYLSVGVFWGSEFRVAGNVYKREANELKYDIEYKSIEEESDLTKVIVEVTPTYVGEYNVRGKEISEFIDEKKTLELYLREDKNGDYKLTQLNNELIKKMEVEIGEEIELNQPKESPVYPKLEEFIYESEEQREGMYFVYDIFTRLAEGGIDKLYDRYDKLWIEDKQWFQLEKIRDKLTPENITIDYKGWDYVCTYAERNEIKDIIAFDVVDKEVVRISYMTESSEMQGTIDQTNNIIKPFNNLLKNEMKILLGENIFEKSTVEDLRKYLNENYHADDIEMKTINQQNEWSSPNSHQLMMELRDEVRFSQGGKLLEWVINQKTKRYNLIYPPGNITDGVYQDNSFIFFWYGPYFSRNKKIDPVIETTYNFNCINYYLTKRETLLIEVKKSNWEIDKFDGTELMQKKYKLIDVRNRPVSDD